MADNYSWSDANNKGYKTGNYASVDGKITPITRDTVADGDLLNADIVEVLSSRDMYMYDSINELEDKINFVIDQVSTNSADEWNNAKLSGFSAIKCDGTFLAPSKPNEVLNITTEGIDTSVNGTTLTLSMPDFYSSSYMLQASAHLSKGGDQVFTAFFDDKQDWSTYRATNFVFGYNNKLRTYDKGFAVDGSDARAGGIAVHNSTANNGIAFNNSTGSKSVADPGIAFNNSYAGLCSVAFNSSTASTNCNFAVNNSQSTNDIAIAINDGYSTGCGISINGTSNNTNNTVGLSFAYGKSYSFNNGVSFFDSTACYGGFGAYQASAAACVSLYSCTTPVNTVGLAMFNSYMSGAAVACDHSTAKNESFAFKGSSADSFSVAMCTAYAHSQGVACHLSTADNYATSLYQNSIAKNHSFAMYLR